MGDKDHWHQWYGEQERSHGTPVNTRIMIAAVVVLVIVVLFILLLHVYARWFWRNARLRSRGGWSLRRRRRFQFAAAEIMPVQGGAEVAEMNKGLDKSVLETLPIFYYTNRMEDVLDCSVCLSEFEENEAGRRLPKCNHIFHTDCIDMWLGSHTTCPLCRASVLSVDEEQGKEQVGEELLREAAMVGLQGRGEENSVAIQILQDEGAVLLTGAAHPQTQHQDHLVVNLTPSLNSPRTDGPTTPPPSNSGSVQQAQFPASVLFWGNQTYVTATTEVATGDKVGTSSSASPRRKQLVIEVPRRSGVILSPSPCSSQFTSPSTAGGEGQRSPGLGTHLRNLKRLLSRDSRRCSSPDCYEQHSFHSACHTPGSNSVSGCHTPV